MARYRGGALQKQQCTSHAVHERQQKFLQMAQDGQHGLSVSMSRAGVRSREEVIDVPELTRESWACIISFKSGDILHLFCAKC